MSEKCLKSRWFVSGACRASMLDERSPSSDSKERSETGVVCETRLQAILSDNYILRSM